MIFFKGDVLGGKGVLGGSIEPDRRIPTFVNSLLVQWQRQYVLDLRGSALCLLRTSLWLNSPQLLLKNFLSKNDSGAPITQAEFLARAWQAANAKACELGWIV